MADAPSADRLPYFERGLLAELVENRDEISWSWRIEDLTMPVQGCGTRAVTRAVNNLIAWGYLRLWKEGLGPGRGWAHRWKAYPNGDAPPQDEQQRPPRNQID